jgi:hypothetical protein
MEFEMPVNPYNPAWRALDAFTQAYIEAMFWTDVCNPDSTEFGEDASFDDMATETLADIVEGCRAFQETNADLLDAAYSTKTSHREYTAASAGHDYWLTRNGHGVGFWDRGLGEVGDKLSEACGRREMYVYRGDDEKIHVG